jgi:prepilin-type N-terminal cleavage/methylation domain-containing protein
MRRAGFTLIELMAVMLIIALATSLAVPAFRDYFRQDDMTEATDRMRALFQLARDSAVRSGLPVTVVIDSISGLVWLDAPVPPALDEEIALPQTMAAPRLSTPGFAVPGTLRGDVFVQGESIELPPTVLMELTRARALFAFQPTGRVFADTVYLRASMRTVLITADRWTGDLLAY